MVTHDVQAHYSSILLLTLTIEDGCVAEDNTERTSLEDLIARSISVSEASQISGFTPAWIRRLLIRGELVGFKIGRDWRLTREALHQYLEKERRPGPKTE